MYTVRARVFDAHNFIILVLARSKHIQQHTATKPKFASDIIPRGTTRCEVFRFAGARGDDNYCVLSIEGHNDGDSIARTRPSRLSLRYARRYQLLRGVIVQKPHVQQCHEMTRDQGKISFFFFLNLSTQNQPICAPAARWTFCASGSHRLDRPCARDTNESSFLFSCVPRAHGNRYLQNGIIWLTSVCKTQ